jgi:hypothetical protein
MKKVKAFEGNGKYERIWWYWQSKKEYVGVCNPKKNPSTMYVEIKERGTKGQKSWLF